MTTPSWYVFETPLGYAGLVWHARAITRVCLPEPDAKSVQERLAKITGQPKPAKTTPPFAKSFMRKATRHLNQIPQDFSDAKIDVSDAPAFHREIYRAALKIPSGTLVSYGELATLAGRPGAARAVGQAMGRNPLPLIVPCHRVTASGGKLGGFTAQGGVSMKLQLLEAEGVRIGPVAKLPGGRALEKVARELANTDPLMARLITDADLPNFKPKRQESPYETLFSAIIHQQLHGAAAKTILGRVMDLDWGAIPSPEKFLKLSDKVLRGAGLSRNKLAALRDLARKTIDGVVPTRKEMEKMTDAAIIRRLVSIHGVGQWTVEMLLIFSLARPDVLPVHDYAVKVAFARLHGMKTPPTPREMARLGAKWAPYRSLASLYLWKSLDS